MNMSIDLSHVDVNLIILMIIGALQAYQSYTARKTGQNMSLLERNTNSLKDALVASTAKASLAEGTASGIIQGHAAGLLQGRGESDASRADPKNATRPDESLK